MEGGKVEEGAASAARRRPNILVTGGVGVGKTTTSDMIAAALNMTVIHVGDWISEKGFHAEERDMEHDAWVLDEESEDKLMDAMEPHMAKGGIIVDFHSCEFFPERWFDLVLVLRCDNTKLFDRLTKRGYKVEKVKENVQAEIMQVVLEEARQSYALNIIQEVRSDSVDDMESNVERTVAWVKTWEAKRGGKSATK